MRRITPIVLSLLVILTGANTAVFAKDSINRTITFENVTSLTGDGELRHVGIYSSRAETREKCALNIDRRYTHNESSQSILFNSGTVNRTFFYNTDSAVVMGGESTNEQTVSNCFCFEFKYYFKVREFEDRYADDILFSDDVMLRYGTNTSYRTFAGLMLQVISGEDGKCIKMKDGESISVNPWENGENDWVEIKRIFNFEKCTVDTYANGTLLLSKPVEGLTHVRYSSIRINGAEVDNGVFFDDISSKTLEKPPVIDTLNAERDCIKLTFSKPMDASSITKDAFTLATGAQQCAISAAEYLADENMAVLFPTQIMHLEEEYTLTVSGDVKSVGGAAMGDGEATVRKFTLPAEEFDVLKVSSTGEKIEARLRNTTGGDKSALMLVLFKNAQGNVVACEYSKTCAILPEGTTLSANLPGKGEKSCEAFFIDNWTNRIAIKKYIYNIGSVK